MCSTKDFKTANEDKEEDLPGLQDEDVDEPQQRWMAPSLFGSMFGNGTASSQQPEAEMVDEVTRRGGRPQEAQSQQFSSAMKT